MRDLFSWRCAFVAVSIRIFSVIDNKRPLQYVLPTHPDTIHTMAPSPRLQKLNALVHQEPYASIAYSIFWTWFLVVVAPLVAMCVLPVLAVYRLVAWYKDWWGVEDFNPRSAPHVDTTEMAIVITGCDSGFGKELALWAAEAGFVVFAGCLSQDSFDQFNIKSNNNTGTIIPMVMNVTSDDDVKKAVDQVSKWMNEKSSVTTNIKKKRVLHALINNAGITKVGFFDWIEVDDYRNVMEVNYFGLLRTCKAFLPMLKKQGIDGSHQRGTRIINLTSVAGLLKTAPIGSSYAASKHAAQSVTEALREELASFDIQVASVNPSFHSTAIVSSVAANLEKTWNDLTPAQRQEYGTDFKNGICNSMDGAISAMSWNLQVVVDQILQTLKQREIPGQVLVGLDAKYMFMWMRMLPPWTNAVKSTWASHMIPDAMKKKQT